MVIIIIIIRLWWSRHSTCAEHSGDWLFAVPFTSCGLHLDDEAVRVAVCLRLGLDVCSSHECHCDSAVDVRGIHSFICKKAPDKIMRHQALNDLIARSFSAADVPVTKEPSGLLRSDGKRLMVFHWSHGKVA